MNRRHFITLIGTASVLPLPISPSSEEVLIRFITDQRFYRDSKAKYFTLIDGFGKEHVMCPDNWLFDDSIKHMCEQMESICPIDQWSPGRRHVSRELAEEINDKEETFRAVPN